MTREQYEVAKAAITADYIKEKQKISDEFNGRLAVVEESYRKAKKEFHEAGQRNLQSQSEAKEWYERKLSELKLWLLGEEQKAAGEYCEIQKIRLRYKEMRAKLMEEVNIRQDAGDRLFTMSKIAYSKTHEGWRINVRELSRKRAVCINEALRFMTTRLESLPMPDAAEEGGAE